MQVRTARNPPRETAIMTVQTNAATPALDDIASGPTMGSESAFETSLAAWRKRLDYTTLVTLHEQSYTRKKFLGSSTETCPALDWIVRIEPSTQNIRARVAETHEAWAEDADDKGVNRKVNMLRELVNRSGVRVESEWKQNAGKPEGVVEVAQVILYLYATRRCHSMEIKNIGSVADPEYDIGKTKCERGVMDAGEERFFGKIGEAESALLWGGSSVRSLEIRVMSI